MDKQETAKKDEKEPKKSPVKAKKEKILKIKESEHQGMVEELAETKDKYLRLCSDFENARKRMDREKIEFIKYANVELITDFLGILDNLDLSVQAAKDNHKDYEAFLKGIEMVLANTHEILKKNGVASIEAKGKPFDPYSHEILLQEEVEDQEEGIVLEELQKGYSLGDKVIRTVKVKVSKKKSE